MSGFQNSSRPGDDGERFQMLGQLGAGTMCVVYKVLDRKHGDVVALKTLRHLDSNSLYRLKQEFRALSHLDHPNLVSFSELVASDDGWFVTMELVEGVDFLTFCRGEESERDDGSSAEGSTWSTQTDIQAGEGSLDDRPDHADDRGLPDLVKLRSTMRQLAEGIQALHDAGRVHRDLKPSNVMVTHAGRVVVLDFGLVAEIDQDYTEGTLHQNIAGSAAYMSPEQSVGKPLSEASDWYAVGVMLYESLTGVWPYQGHLYQILTAKQEEDPPPPNTLVAGVPQELNDLAMGLLSREPEDRPSGAQVIAAFRGGAGRRKPVRRLQPRFRFREGALAELQQSFDVARTGRPVTQLIRGPVGIGKTTLVREFIKAVKRQGDVVVLKSQCFEWETVPYKALDGLMDNLSRALRRLDHRDVGKLANPGLPYLSALFPVLSRVDAFALTEPADLDRIDEATIRQRGFEGLFELLGGLAARVPVVMFLDDIQWGDAGSGGVLGEILKFAGPIPLLVVLGYRSKESSPFIQRFLPPVQAASVPVRTLDLEPLTFEQAAVVAGEMLDLGPGDPVVRDVAMKSKGIPQFVKALVRQRDFQDGRAAGDDQELSAVTVDEIQALPRPAQRLLGLLALCDEPVPDGLALGVAELSGGAFEAISTLRAHHLVNVTGAQGGDTLEIGSEPVREYVLTRIPDDWRTGFHERLAVQMEAAGGYRPESLVRHYAGAGRYDKAGLTAWLSSDDALDKGRLRDAVWLLERAREYGEWAPRERRMISNRLGDVLARLGAGARAAVHYLEAADGSVDLRAQSLRRLAIEQQLTSGELDEGEAGLNKLLGELGVSPGGGGGGWFGLGAVRRIRKRWRGLDFTDEPEDKIDESRLLALDLLWSGTRARELVDISAAADLQAVHLDTALEIGEPERALRSLATEVRTVALSGGDEWRERYEHVLKQGRARGSRTALARATAAAATGALVDGRWVEAAEFAASAEHMLEHHRIGAAWERFDLRMVATRALLQRGDFREAADRALPVVRKLDHAGNALFLTLMHAGVVSWLRMAEDEADSALGVLAQIPAHLGSRVSIPFFHLVVAWTHLEIYRGNSTAAWTYLDARWAVTRAGLSKAPSMVVAQLWLTRARAALAAAPEDDAAARLADAKASIAAVVKLGLPWTQPWTQWLEAAVIAVETGTRTIDPAIIARFQQTDQSMGGAMALLSTGESSAAVWLTEQGVREPERFSSVFAPGLWS